MLETVLELRLHAANGDDRAVGLGHLVAHHAGEFILGIQVVVRDVADPRVPLDRKRGSLGPAVRGEPHPVIPRRHHGPLATRAPENQSRERGPGLCAQVPGEAVEARLGGESPPSTAATASGRARVRCRGYALEGAQHLPVGIQDLEFGLVRRVPEPPRDRDPRGRAHRERWGEQLDGLGRHVRGRLAEWLEVVEHPEPASVRADHELVVLDDQIDHRDVGKAWVQLLPHSPIVVRNVDPVLRCGVEQPLAVRVLSDRMHVGVLTNATHDVAPRLAVVVGSEDVG